MRWTHTQLGAAALVQKEQKEQGMSGIRATVAKLIYYIQHIYI